MLSWEEIKVSYSFPTLGFCKLEVVYFLSLAYTGQTSHWNCLYPQTGTLKDVYFESKSFFFCSVINMFYDLRINRVVFFLFPVGCGLHLWYPNRHSHTPGAGQHDWSGFYEQHYASGKKNERTCSFAQVRYYSAHIRAWKQKSKLHIWTILWKINWELNLSWVCNFKRSFNFFAEFLSLFSLTQLWSQCYVLCGVDVLLFFTVKVCAWKINCTKWNVFLAK